MKQIVLNTSKCFVLALLKNYIFTILIFIFTVKYCVILFKMTVTQIKTSQDKA